MDTKKILFIEDDDFLRSLAVTKLQKESFAVGTSPDANEVITILEREQPDLLLLDLLLPGTHGFEALATIRQDDTWKNLKVIIFSNLGDPEDIKKGQSLGVIDYLVKANFTLDELVEKIKEALV